MIGSFNGAEMTKQLPYADSAVYCRVRLAIRFDAVPSIAKRSSHPIAVSSSSYIDVRAIALRIRHRHSFQLIFP